MLPNLIGESPQINFLFSPRPEVVITIFHATFTMEMSVLLCPYRVIKWVIKFGFRSKNLDFSINVRFSTCWFFFFFMAACRQFIQRHYLRQIYTPLLLFDLVGEREKISEGRFEHLFAEIE